MLNLVCVTNWFDCTEQCSIFRNAVGELINRGAKTDVMCDYPKSELRAFIGQLPKRRGQHYAFEKQYVQSHKGVNPTSRCINYSRFNYWKLPFLKDNSRVQSISPVFFICQCYWRNIRKYLLE